MMWILFLGTLIVSALAAVVVAVGGDGTINEAAQGLLGTGTPMAILPGGTSKELLLLADKVVAPSVTLMAGAQAGKCTGRSRPVPAGAALAAWLYCSA